MKFYNLLMILLLGINTKLQACGIQYHLPSHAYNPTAVTISPDGTLLATTGTMSTGAGAVILFFIDNGVLSDSASYPLKSRNVPNALAFSSNGQFLATANSAANSITVFMVIRNTELVEVQEYTLPSGCKSPQSLAFSPDGSMLAVSNSSSHTIVVFKASQEGLLSEPEMYSLPSGAKSPEALAFSPDGSIIATVNSSTNNVTTFKINAGVLTEPTSYALPAGAHAPQSLAFSPDGSLLATGNYDSDNVTVFNVTSGMLSNGVSYKLPAYCVAPNSIAFSSDGNYLALGMALTNQMALFTVTNGMLDAGKSYELSEGLFSTSIAFLPQSPYIASGTTAVIGDESINSNIIVMLNTTVPCVQSNSCGAGCIASMTAMGIAGMCVLVGCSLWIADKFFCKDSAERQKLIES